MKNLKSLFSMLFFAIVLTSYSTNAIELNTNHNLDNTSDMKTEITADDMDCFEALVMIYDEFSDYGFSDEFMTCFGNVAYANCVGYNVSLDQCSVFY